MNTTFRFAVRFTALGILSSAALLFGNSVQFSGQFSNPNQVVCANHNNNCFANYSNTVDGITYSGGISGSGHFMNVAYDGITRYGSFGEALTPGSTVFSAVITTQQGNDHGNPQLNPNPLTIMAGSFDIPDNTGDWGLQVYFQNAASTNPGNQDNVAFSTPDGGALYVKDSCTTDPISGVSVCGQNYQNFVINHTSGTPGAISWTSSSFAYIQGVDQINMDLIFTNLDPNPPAVAPEPASLGIMGLGMLGLAGGLRSYRLRKQRATV